MSVTDARSRGYRPPVARWQEGTRGRLQQAAVGLFAAHGYAATTTEQIAAAAGVTQRTFFRHFRDKEEVLFAEDDVLLAALLDGVRAVPADAAPAAVVRAALGSLAGRLGDGREDQRARAAVVASDPALVGRDLAKQARWVEALAEVLAARGGRAVVFRGDDGLDELTTATTSSAWVVRDGVVVPDRVDPAELGIPVSGPDALRGGSPAYNADVFRRVVAGEQGPVRDAVLLNAAAALAAFDEHSAGLHEGLAAGLERAAAAVDDGRAAALLQRWVSVSREVAGRG